MSRVAKVNTISIHCYNIKEVLQVIRKIEFLTGASFDTDVTLRAKQQLKHGAAIIHLADNGQHQHLRGGRCGDIVVSATEFLRSASNPK